MTLTLTVGRWELHLTIARHAPDEHPLPDEQAPPVHIETPMSIYVDPLPQPCGFTRPMEA
ncbi:hypothetical protein ACTQ2Q_09345 [Atopobiaceae bacterium LCP21S3_F11]|uniref:hypothetical protein n=1 Tax=Coriobacteriia TaxID=84998 RepID=UPI003F8B2DEC